MTPEADEARDLRREVTRTVLAAIDANGFALAGAGAILEHGVSVRPTEDVDLFTARTDTEGFAASVTTATDVLRQRGFNVALARSTGQFARLQVARGNQSIEVDLGMDWRRDPPVRLDQVGPVLSLADAAASKVLALYSRREARDYLDVDAIRQRGPFSDDELLELAADRDPGFERAMFANQLRGITAVTLTRVERYGLNRTDLADVQERTETWADQIDNPPQPSSASAALRAQATAHLHSARQTADRVEVTAESAEAAAEQNDAPRLREAATERAEGRPSQRPPRL